MRDHIVAIATRRKSGQHPGLLLQRFLVKPATGRDGDPEEKKALLDAAIAAAGNDNLRQMYKTAFDRWDKSLPKLAKTPKLVKETELATQSRLIVGLGSENVLETGIRLHHTYGLPVIPGSALKGLAAHYCHDAWGQSANPTASDVNKRFRRPTEAENKAYQEYLQGKGEPPEDNYHRLLFGVTDDSGCIIFHDAWLTPDSQNPLAMDVMTPHHPQWIDGKVPPTDFDSPVPVPFVSVSGKFRIVVSWSGPPCDAAEAWAELARDLVVEALREWGVGGKTSSGYGRLMDPETLTRERNVGGGAAAAQKQRPHGAKAIVKIVAERKKGGFDVQEEARPQGTLTLGSPPEEIDTSIGAVVNVFVHNDDPNKPQYTWTDPASRRKKQKTSKRRR